MKYIYLILLLLFLSNCKQDNRQESTIKIETIEDTEHMQPSIEDSLQPTDKDIKKLD